MSADLTPDPVADLVAFTVLCAFPPEHHHPLHGKDVGAMARDAQKVLREALAERDSLRAEVERLKASIKDANDYICRSHAEGGP